MRESEPKQNMKPSQTPGKLELLNTPRGEKQEKNTRRDAWPDFHLMEMISIIHLTAGGLRRQSQQTGTHTVQSVSQTNDWEITHNSKLAPALLPADQIWPFVQQRFMRG